MWVQGSCCSFSLAPQRQMAGPILLAVLSQRAPPGHAEGREGGREAEVPRLAGCVTPCGHNALLILSAGFPAGIFL